MTATIAPPLNMPGSVRSDPKVRADDYFEALRYYASLDPAVIKRIVFLENSGADLEIMKRRVAASCHREIEYLSLNSVYPPEKGKGYGEFRMIDEALSRLNNIEPDAVIWKVTGRLKILNFERLIGTAPAGFSVYCDLRRVPLIGEAFGGNQWMELRTFAFTATAYHRLFEGQYDKNFVLEKSFFKILGDEIDRGDKTIVPRFGIQPIIDGYSGYSNKHYRSLSYRAKESVRIIGRRLIPRLWL